MKVFLRFRLYPQRVYSIPFLYRRLGLLRIPCLFSERRSVDLPPYPFLYLFQYYLAEQAYTRQPGLGRR
ncbi:hypothetical protein D3C75_1244080 [compost metagenome]